MAWSTLATYWLKTAERSTPNGDGTFTLVEAWMGADNIDHDLYDTVTPQSSNSQTGDGDE